MKLLKIGTLGIGGCIFLKSVHEVRRFVETYFDELNDGAPVIGDLSLMSREAVSSLLKFLEEGVDDIICYASRDNVNPVLMSRFDRVENNEVMQAGSYGFDYFLKHIEDRERIDSLEREFLLKAADQLDTYLMYRRLEPSIISRVRHLL